MMVTVGERVQDFSLEAYIGGEMRQISLSDYKGKWVVLFFYPADFSFVCPTEIRGFAKREEEFNKINGVILAASTDSIYSHKAWFEQELSEVKFPILADPAHRLSRAYGVLIEDEGVALRATFIIDPEGVLRYTVVSDLNTGRSVQETLRVLRALQTGELCPIDWQPGEETLGRE